MGAAGAQDRGDAVPLGPLRDHLVRGGHPAGGGHRSEAGEMAGHGAHLPGQPVRQPALLCGGPGTAVSVLYPLTAPPHQRLHLALGGLWEACAPAGHAAVRAVPVWGGQHMPPDPVQYAGGDPPGLYPHRPLQGPAGAGGDRRARDAQRTGAGDHTAGQPAGLFHRRRHVCGERVLHPRHRFTDGPVHQLHGCPGDPSLRGAVRRGHLAGLSGDGHPVCGSGSQDQLGLRRDDDA